jgi:hypothetical protein
MLWILQHIVLFTIFTVLVSQGKGRCFKGTVDGIVHCIGIGIGVEQEGL